MSGSERRRSQRRPVLESFSLFVVVPKKGGYKLKVHDLSEGGILFDVDLEGENLADFPIKPSETMELQLYLNQTLFLPLGVKVIRVEERDGVRRIGAQLTGGQGPGQKAYTAFIQMLDAIAATGQLNP